MQRADFTPSYFRRYLWVTLACVAYTLWCCYDAFIAYPKKGEISAAYESLQQQFEETERPLIELPRAWEKVAGPKGWSTIQPGKTTDDIRADIGKQYFMMVLCGLIGVPAFIKWARGQKTWVEGNEELIRNSSGQELKISEITKIDKRKWDEKGIALIHYLKDGKRKKKFVMDDFKFDRDSMSKILQNAEASLKPDQIVGGLSESALAKKKEDDAAKKSSVAADPMQENPSEPEVEENATE